MTEKAQRSSTRRGASQMAWKDLGADQVDAAIQWRWPWDPDGSAVAGRLLEPGYPLPTDVETQPRQTDEDGQETQPAVRETQEHWVHRVHVDEWDAATSLELDGDAQVTLL
jgi:hypothetical protein